MLDREIRDAATGVERERPDERLGRARVQARATGAAAVGLRGVGFELGGRQDDADEEVRAEIGIDEIGVLPDPAEPGGRGEIALEDGARVDSGAAASLAAGGVLDEARERVEPRPYDVVIVTAAGISGDLSLCRCRTLGRRVEHRHRDDGASAG